MPMARNSSVYVYNVYADSKKINIHKIISEEQIRFIKTKYSKIVSANTYGVISIQRAYVIVENCIYDGARFPYTYTRDGKYSNIGRLIIKNDDKVLKSLKKDLSKLVGIRR